MEKLEKGVKYVHSRQQKHQSDDTDIVFVFLLKILNIFYKFF